MSDRSSAVAPVAGDERIGVLDVLRGFALLGVLIANLVGFGGVDAMATKAQLDALPTAPQDRIATFVYEWLVHDKANTLFAFLFGVGFSIQLSRLRERSTAAERIYLRRLIILLVFGLAHFFLLWPWDILHLYAAAGLVLFAIRGASDRVLIVGGLILAFFGRYAVEFVMTAAGVMGPAFDAAYSDEAILARQMASQSGDYGAWIAAATRLTALDWWASGLFWGWLLYALGRFMVGAWVARRGWLQRAADLRPAFARLAMVALPLGLSLALAAVLTDAAVSEDRLAESPWESIASLGHLIATPVLATGYACLVVLAATNTGARPVTRALAAVGRMALTNYVTQSLIIAFVLLGIGPGLGLAGRIGAMALFLIAVGAFVCQVALSALWMRYFAYGPLEYLWRTLTYGRAPRLRLAAL